MPRSSTRQIYRIDHYLGKETVQNILVFRFANGIFEPIWNRRYIDHVQITVAESVGVEGRGGYYEEAGALRDMIQNHLLQLLSLVAMEPPATFEADAVRDEKVKVLRAVRPDARAGPDGRRARPVRRRARSAASRCPATARSRRSTRVETETFIAARLFVDNWRWAGVPFYLRTGKRLPKRATEIAIQFKEAAAPSCSTRTVRRTRSRTCSRCASSPTRASCSASRPRCRASASTSAT